MPYDSKFLFEELCYNLEPSEIGAAFSLVQLDKLDRNIAAREHNFKRQLAFFSRYEEWFILPLQMPASRTGWLAFPLTIRPDATFTRTPMQIWLAHTSVAEGKSVSVRLVLGARHYINTQSKQPNCHVNK